ncbi:UNVERIFIED_CONTAM: Beta-glucosidase 14 [Sesamum calycinum]|uniref:Beta-glucosidase 14 n=1 Tax=Sesamum calycinum TaxID=2727403 RepID=A0AAW2JNX0_9LAMI
MRSCASGNLVDRVKYWMTLNEPWSYAYNGYVSYEFPPGLDPQIHSLPASIVHSPPPVASQYELYATPPVASRYKLYATPPVAALYNLYSTPPVADLMNSTTSPPAALPQTSPKMLKFIPYRSRPHHHIEQHHQLLNHIEQQHQLLNAVPSNSIINNQRVNNIGTTIYKLYSEPDPPRDAHAAASNLIYYSGSKRKRDPAKDAYTVGRNLLLAHALAVHSYRTKFQERQKGQIGIALNTFWCEFLEPVLTGQYPKTMRDCVPSGNLAAFSDGEAKMLKGSIDFLGLNYYTALYAANDPNPSHKQGYKEDQRLHLTYTDPHEKLIGWTKRTTRRSQLKMLVADSMREDYHKRHLVYLLKAMKDKQVPANVKGYFVWSWCDNFEWAVGYTVRFGLMYVDYENHQKRYPKASAIWFAKFLGTFIARIKGTRDIQLQILCNFGEDEPTQKNSETEKTVNAAVGGACSGETGNLVRESASLSLMQWNASPVTVSTPNFRQWIESLDWWKNCDHEGGAVKGGRGPSIWDVFTLNAPGRIDDGSNGNVAADMYTKYKDDIKMMRSMGFDAYRFSISWSRILPDMKPFITLFHFDLPQSLQQEYDGFLSRDVVVKYWITLNEPWSYAHNGYVTRKFPPLGRDLTGLYVQQLQLHLRQL